MVVTSPRALLSVQPAFGHAPLDLSSHTPFHLSHPPFHLSHPPFHLSHPPVHLNACFFQCFVAYLGHTPLCNLVWVCFLITSLRCELLRAVQMASLTEDGPKPLICESDRGVSIDMLDLVHYLTQRSNRPCDPSSHLGGRGATQGCWHTGCQTDEVGEEESNLTSGLLTKIIVVEEVGMFDPGA